MTWTLLVLSTVLAFEGPAESAEAEVSFTREVAPIFARNCVACHDEKTKKGRYDMSTYEGIMAGGGKGAAIVPGEPFDSTLVLMMYGDEEPVMPKDADLLDEATVAIVERWVQQGAKYDGPRPAMKLAELVPAAPKKIPTDYTTPTPITALAFSPDGAELAVAGYHEITFWNPANGDLLRRRPTTAERIHALQYSPDGTKIVQAGGIPGQQGEVVVWDAKTLEPLRTLGSSGDIFYAACFSPDGGQVAAGGADRIFRVWNVADGNLIHQVENHADWILGIAFTPDGQKIITASRDKTAKVWDQSTREPVLTFAGHGDGVYGVAINPDGSQAASAGADTHLRLWNTSGDGKQVKDLAAHGGTIHAVRFAPKSNTIFTAGADRLIKAWNTNADQPVRTFEGHADWVYALAISADELRLASGAWDGAVHVWDTQDGKLIAKFLAVPSLAAAAPSTPPATAEPESNDGNAP